MLPGRWLLSCQQGRSQLHAWLNQLYSELAAPPYKGRSVAGDHQKGTWKSLLMKQRGWRVRMNVGNEQRSAQPAWVQGADLLRAAQVWGGAGPCYLASSTAGSQQPTSRLKPCKAGNPCVDWTVSVAVEGAHAMERAHATELQQGSCLKTGTYRSVWVTISLPFWFGSISLFILSVSLPTSALRLFSEEAQVLLCLN